MELRDLVERLQAGPYKSEAALLETQLQTHFDGQMCSVGLLGSLLVDLDTQEVVGDGRSELLGAISTNSLVGDQVTGSSQLELGHVVLQLLDDDLASGGRGLKLLLIGGGLLGVLALIIALGVAHDSNKLLQYLDFFRHVCS